MPSSNVHPTAIIHPTAKIDASVTISPYAVIGEDVVLRAGVHIGPHAVVEFAEIGENAKIAAGAFIGTAPQDLKYKGERTRVSVGARTVVRECVTLNRGTEAHGITEIGSDCLFMAYSHAGHDCIIGNHVIVANGVALAGHVEVGDYAVLGGLAAVHQFARIGTLAMVGGGAMVPLDIPPYCMAAGDRAKLTGLNLLGLRRKGLNASQVASIKKLYRDLFFTDQPIKENLQHLMSSTTESHLLEFLTFIQKSERGICRPRKESRPSSDDN